MGTESKGFILILGLLSLGAAENKYGDHGIVLTALPFKNAEDYRQLVMMPETPRNLSNARRPFAGMVLKEDSRLYSCAVDYDKNLLYLYDEEYRSLVVASNFSTSMKKEDFNFTTEHNGVSKEYVKIAVDWISQNVYWTDTVMGGIMMQPEGQGINRTQNKLLIKTGLDLPRGLAVDPISGFLFWGDFAKESKIERSNLLGEDRIILIGEALKTPDALAADHVNQRLYFTNRDSIESVFYNGTGRKLLTKNTDAYYFDLAIFEDVLMATNTRTPYNLQFFDINTGERIAKESGGEEAYHGVCMYHKDSQPPPAQARCPSAGCEDLCVDDPSKPEATCLCRNGHELNPDGKTCKYTTGQYYRAIVLANETHICLLDLSVLSDLHTHEIYCFYQHTDTTEKIKMIEVKGSSREVYFATNNAIYRVPIDGENPQAVKLTQTLPNYNGNGNVTGMSYDQLSNHLYWSETDPDALFVMNPDNPPKEFLQLTPNLHNMTNLKGILVIPHERKLLWLSGKYEYGVDKVIILQTDLGASAPVQTIIPTEVKTHYIRDATHMYHNVKDETLYILDLWWDEIQVYNYTGTYKTDYDVTDAQDFVLYQDYILVAQHDNNNNTAIFSADLGWGPPFHLVSDGVIDGIGLVQSIKILDADVLQPQYPNPCTDLNGKAGGCDQTCFHIGDYKAVCKCGFGYTLNEDGKTCDSYPVMDNFIVVADVTHSRGYQISLDTPEGIAGIDLAGQTMLTGILFNYLTKKIIVGSSVSDQIWTVNLDGSNKTMLFDVYRYFASPKGFALDPTTGNLYFTGFSFWSGWFDDSFVGIVSPSGAFLRLHEGGTTLEDIVLHPQKGYMFWVDVSLSGGKVRRASMDGSNVVELSFGIDVEKPKGLAIDYAENKLYWTDTAQKNIYRSELDGNNAEMFLENVGEAADIRIVGDYLYYTTGEKTQVTRVLISNTSEVEMFGPTAGTGVLGALDVYISSEIPNIPVHDVCSKNNGECSDFCLPNQAGGRSCGCPQGVDLLTDYKTCETSGCHHTVKNAYIDSDCLRVPGQKCNFTCFSELQPKKEKLLTCQSNLTWDDDTPCKERAYQNKYNDHGVVVTARGFDLQNFRQVIVMPRTPLDIPNYYGRQFPGFRFADVKKKLYACDVDYHANMLFMYDYEYRSIIAGSNFSAEASLESMNFTTERYGISQEMVKIAVDWVSHNIYWTDPLRGAIMMQPARQNVPSSLVRIVYQKHLNLPRGIAVDPLAGYIFWTDWSRDSVIGRASLLGENGGPLPINSLYTPDAIAADHQTRRIYYTNYILIESANYDGLDRRVVVKMSQAQFFDIAIFNGVIMATDITKYYVNFYNATTGKEVITSEGSGSDAYFGVCMYHMDAQPIAPDELCVDSGCMDICVQEPNAVEATCLCRTGYELEPDGKSCKEVAGQYQRAILLNNGTHLCLLVIDILSDHQDHKVDCFYQHKVENETMTYVDSKMKSREVYFSTAKSIYRVPIRFAQDLKATLLKTTPGDKITGLAYDWINNHLYFSQTGPDGVFLIKPDSPQDFSQIATPDDTYLPRAVLVTPHDRKLYWIATNRTTGNTSLIEYGDLGLSRPAQTIVPTEGGNLRNPTHLLHDPKRDLMYILDDGWSVIFRAYYNGTLKDYFQAADAKDFALYMDFLLIMEHDKDGNTRLYSGDLGLGDPLSITADGIVEDIGTVISIKIIDVNVLQKLYPSPCGEKEGKYGGCEQICIPIDDKPICRCDTGFTLNEDNITCDSFPREDNVIYVTDTLHDKLYQIPLDNPEEIHGIKIPNEDIPTGFLYNYLTKKILLGSQGSTQIWAVNIDGSNATIIADIGVVSGWRGMAIDFALDPSTGNVYITANSDNADKNQNSLIVAVSPTGGVAVLYDQGYRFSDIVLHSQKGYMFWTDNGNRDIVARAGMDGSEFTIISEGDDTIYPTGLAIDYEDEKLYWEDALYHTLFRSDFDGKHKTTFYTDTTYMMDIEYFDGFLYYTTLDNMHLTKLNKSDPDNNATRMGPTSGIGTFGTIDIYSSSQVSKIPVNAVCSKDNGNCSHFCLPNPEGRRTCGCEAGNKLLSDGQTCENAPRCQATITGGAIDEACHRLIGQHCGYTCHVGFKRKEGVEKLFCQELANKELRWDDETSCEEIFCPATIPNGELPRNCTLKVDDSCIEYKCNEGHEKNENITSLICTGDGTWSTDPNILCIEKCPVLTLERNMATLANTCQRDPEEQCGFTCKENYEPRSSATMIKCLSGSQWDHPTDPLCKEILCNATIPNGRLPQKCTLKVDSSCNEYLCNPGYEKNEAITSLICTKGGVWSTYPDNLCKEKCPELTAERDMATLNGSCKRDPGEQCSFKCKKNFKPASNTTAITCLSGSRWNAVTERLCKEILCPDYVPNGIVHNNCSFKVDATCTFDCSDRFNRNDKVSTLKCLPSGIWNKVNDKTTLCIAIPPQPEKKQDLAIGLGIGLGILVLIIIIILVILMLYRSGKLPGKRSGGSGRSFDNPRYQESSFDEGATGQGNKGFSYATLDDDKLELTEESWKKEQARAPENVYDNSPAVMPATAINPKF